MRATAPLNNPADPPQAANSSVGRDPVEVTAMPERPSVRALLDLCALYMPAADLELIRTAYRTAEAAHSGVTRKSGEPYIEHPIAVARILAELAMDSQGIASALLHDTVEDTSLTVDDVEACFGPVIAGIVDGVTKFTAVEVADIEAADANSADANSADAKPMGASAVGLAAQHDTTSPRELPAISDVKAERERKARAKLETVRKLFLALSQDPRVVLLKLADRLHNMRTLSSMSSTQRDATSHETLDIFAPLAGRIGLHLFKTELEDLAFSFLEPEAFSHTRLRLQEEMERHVDWAQRMCTTIERELAARDIIATVNWRVKRPYRAYTEAYDSGMAVSLLHDLIAFRVLVTSKDDCYRALGIIHHLWHPHDNRIRDYIANPKVNGYQSLHTGVFALDGQLAQIHIRTHEMHRAAQHGVAAYWLERAARGQPVDGTSPVNVEEMLGWVTQIAAWQRELNLSAADFVAALRGDLFDEQVFVFTPKGDIRELPDGSNVLDLAYAIHTKIGDHATGAHVQTNGSDGLLISQDVPLDYVLRSGDVVRVLTDQNVWPQPDYLSIVRTRYAREKVARTLRFLRRAGEADDSTRRLDEQALPAFDSAVRLLHPSGRTARVELGRCCYPVPGDAISGVSRTGRYVTIHRDCCRAMRRVLVRRKDVGFEHADPVRVTWPQIQPLTYRVHLAIEGQDHEGLMHELSVCAAQMGLNVSGGMAYANQARYRAAIALTVDIPPSVRFDYVLRRFRAVPGIVNVYRDTRKGCEEISQ